MLTVFAWSALPAWPLTIASWWIFDIRGVIICCTEAALSVYACASLDQLGRLERAVTRRQDLTHGQMTALIKTVDRLTSGPEPEADAELTVLHAVS